MYVIPSCALEKLNQGHAVKEFSCSDYRYANFLRKDALTHQSQNYSVTYVVLGPGNMQVLGYMTLAFGIYTDPKRVKFPLSTLHIGRLATHKGFVGKGVGKYLILSAFKIALVVADSAGVFGVDLLVDANDDGKLVRYYQKTGFEVLPNNPRNMFLPLETIKKTFI